MRSVLTFATILVLATAAEGRSAPAGPGIDAVKAELSAMMQELQAAAQKRDRAALERIYAPEFVWIHATGAVTDRAQHIDMMLGTTAGPGIRPLSFDPPDELLVSGDVALLRGPADNPVAGRIWRSTLYVRRDGRWQILQMQGTRLLEEGPTFAVAPATLDSYAGSYRRGGSGVVTLFTREGDMLIMQHPGVPRRTLRARDASTFQDESGTVYTFHSDSEGQVLRYSARLPNGREVTSDRVE